MDGNAYALGLAFGLLAGLAVFAIYSLVGKRKNGCAKKYDERQLAAQGKAAKAAFITNLLYMAACIAFFAGVETGRETVITALFVGVLLSAGVYAIFCILHDAYFNLSDSPRRTLTYLGVIAALEFFNFWRCFSVTGLFPNGEPDFSACASLFTGIMVLLVMATALAKLAVDKRRAEDADEES